MHPLGLQVKSGAWRAFAARKLDPKFTAFAVKIFERDQYTCQYCSFQAHEYQEVVNLDQDYTRNVKSNLITACCFCVQCLFLEAVGKGDYGGGTLIYLPEMTQNDLNSLCHVLFCAMNNTTPYQSLAQNLYRGFKFRGQTVEELYGPGSSKPALMGQFILESGKITPAQMTQVLTPLRLLPSHAKFRMQIEAWAQSAANEIPAN